MTQVEVFTLVRSPNGVVITSFKKWVAPTPRQEVQYRTTVEVLDDDPMYVPTAPQGNFGNTCSSRRGVEIDVGSAVPRWSNRQPKWAEHKKSWKVQQPDRRGKKPRKLRTQHCPTGNSPARLLAPLLAAVEAELSESRARMSQEMLDERYPYQPQ